MDKSKNDKTVLLEDVTEDLNVCETIYKTKNKTDERTDTVMALIDTLPEIDKQAIYLFYLEEMKITEISAILQIPAGTVKSRLNRSRKKLREQVKQT